jgi:hypothetical protein
VHIEPFYKPGAPTVSGEKRTVSQSTRPRRLEDRFSRRITLRSPVDHHRSGPGREWHELIGDPTYADAILDRIVHNAHRINLIGESMRRKRKKKSPGSDS